jgi:NADH dehydrogenase
MSIKTVTVLGGSGFVGLAIVRALAKRGYLVKVAARRIELAEPAKTAGEVGQVMLIRANLRVPSSIARVIAGSDAVVNAAGIGWQRGRQRYQAVHAEGAKTVADACRGFGVKRLIHVSGIGADARSSRNPYILSKVAAEDAVVSGFSDATIVRPSVVFGPGDAMFTRMARIACMAPFLPVIGDGSAKVQPVFVGDVAQAVATLLGKPETARSVFELGGPRVYTYREIAALVLHEIDRKKPIVGVPAPLMKVAGFFAQLPAIVGLTPQLTVDQVELMVHDNVVRPGANSLATLGIQPTAAESILPTYLDRFRQGGRYNQHAPA